MTENKHAYIDKISQVVKNILTDRTNAETERITVNIVWTKGENARIQVDTFGKGEYVIELGGADNECYTYR